MAGLANFSSLEHAAALVRMGVDMRAGGEPPPDAFVPTLWRTAYQLVMANGNDRQRDLMLEAAPPGDHLAMFNAFFDPQSAPYRDNRWERDLWLAYIMDRAGESGRAAALLGETPRTTDSGSPLNPAYVAEIEEAMARFSGSTAR
jgi:hypothetical protein